MVAAAVGTLIVTSALGERRVLASLEDTDPATPAEVSGAVAGVAPPPQVALAEGATVAFSEPVDRSRLAAFTKRDHLPRPTRRVDARIEVASVDSLSAIEDTRGPASSRAGLRRTSARAGATPNRRPHRDVRGPAIAPMSVLSAYAPSDDGIETPFDLLLDAPSTTGLQRLLPYGVSGNGRDHWWSSRPLPADVAAPASLKCLAQAVYFEARGESLTGQEAVAQVVVNRVKNPAFPDDVCSVVFQNRRWFNRCQFTFACDRREDTVRDPEAWAIAEGVARDYVTARIWRADIGAATHYHATRVAPKWANLMRAVKTIDNHVFYITTGGGLS